MQSTVIFYQKKLFEKVKCILNIPGNANLELITQFLLYGEKDFNVSTNFIILSSTIVYVLTTKVFGEPLFLE